VLSPKTLNDFIINYADGGSCYALPPAWGPSIAKEERLLFTARFEQETTMNSAAAYSIGVMNNAAANTSAMAAASVSALAVQAAFATMASGNF
jgi:hypothetical protein